MINFTINTNRLEKRIKDLAHFGENSNGGIDRYIGSEADIEARKWLINILENDLGAKVHIDPIANIWAEINGKEELQPLVMGSHHDAVPNGGKYDGAMGVLLGIEVAQSIKEQGILLRHPIKIVSFSAEEPNPYNLSTLGSRVVTGKVSKEEVKKAVNKDTGEHLSDTLLKIGGNSDILDMAQLKSGDMSAFIECHIEQGRILYDKNLSVSVVNKITGIYREEIISCGEANHAGTTIMEYRHDALLAACEASLELERIIKEVHRNDVVGTVGKLNVYPNSANIISGNTEFIMEIRTPDLKIREEILKAFSTSLAYIEEKRGVKFQRKIILNQREVSMDDTVIKAISEAVREIGEPDLELVSMAGHDSVHMTSIGKTGMIFVQSINGKSHCADEATNIYDISKAGNVLLKTILKLDEELD